MNVENQSTTAEYIISDKISKKRPRCDSHDDLLEPFHSSSGQLSLFDVWGNNGHSIPHQSWKIGVKFRKQLKLKNRQIHVLNRNTNSYFSNYQNNQQQKQQVQQQLTNSISRRKNGVIYSSSIASKTNSNTSLFSLHSSSTHSDITDGFEEIDFEFDPNLYKLEVNPNYGLETSWLERLKPILMQPEIISLHQQFQPFHLGYNYKAAQKPHSLLQMVLPPPQLLYNWSRLTPLHHVKVVIIGSKPSQSPNQSHGLAFSQPVNSRPLSGSIESIHRELSIEYPKKFKKPNHGSLVSWAKSGVLLINEIQTTRRDDSKAHSKFGWSQFTIKILQIVSEFGGSMYSSQKQQDINDSSSRKGIVFIAWGEQASQLITSSGIHLSERNHKILTCKASPYSNSAHEDNFFNNHHFISCNQFLSETYGPENEIDWCNLEPIDPPS